LALDLHPHPFNIVLGKILAKRMVGFNFRGLGFLLDLALSDSPAGTHVVDRNLRLVEAIGGKVEDPELRFQVPAECSQWVRSLLTGLGIKPGNFVVVIHPGVGMASKKWPADSFSALVDMITAHPSAEVVLVDKDETRVLPIIDGLMKKRAHNLAGKVDLVELIALIKESRLVIGLESMVVHLAASVGTPVVELHSGQSSSGEWGVYQGDYEIITKDVDCAPCGRTRCEDNLCMTLITPTEVFSATKRLAAKVYGDESPFR
jgi:ADP-heptose:LPS heptosyltransferase